MDSSTVQLPVTLSEVRPKNWPLALSPLRHRPHRGLTLGITPQGTRARARAPAMGMAGRGQCKPRPRPPGPSPERTRPSDSLRLRSQSGSAKQVQIKTAGRHGVVFYVWEVFTLRSVLKMWRVKTLNLSLSPSPQPVSRRASWSERPRPGFRGLLAVPSVLGSRVEPEAGGVWSFPVLLFGALGLEPTLVYCS